MTVFVQYRLVRTCIACPEQYNVYDGSDNLIGYMRLRHGRFYTSTEPLGEVLYESYPEGDGIFDDNERDYHLTKGLNALKEHYGHMGVVE